VGHIQPRLHTCTHGVSSPPYALILCSGLFSWKNLGMFASWIPLHQLGLSVFVIIQEPRLHLRYRAFVSVNRPPDIWDIRLSFVTFATIFAPMLCDYF